MMLKKIISGGQTGVDRAALDVAIELGIPHSGYCTLGRKAEDGVIPDKYQLIQMASPNYSVRTAKNVLESDATLILSPYPLTGGTELTWKECLKIGRLLLVEYWDRGFESAARVRCWLDLDEIEVLNIAGPRESKCPGIYQASVAFLKEVLAPGGKQ